jgi:hypothetical protein
MSETNVLNLIIFVLKLMTNDFCKYFTMEMSKKRKKERKKEKKGLNVRVRKISQMLMVIATFVDLD